MESCPRRIISRACEKIIKMEQDQEWQSKEDKARRKDVPRIFLNCFRNHSQRTCKCKKTYSRVPVEEIRNLLHLSLLGKESLCKPRWCTLRRAQEISKVLVVVMHGVSSSCYRNNQGCFTMLSKISQVQTKVGFSSKQDLASALFKTSATRSSSGRLKVSDTDGTEDDRQGRASYLVSRERMFQMNYPLPEDENIVSTNHAMNNPLREGSNVAPNDLSQDVGNVIPNNPLRDDGNVVTPDDTDAVSDSSPLFGLDCEMCQTEEGLELAKVCLLNEDGELIYSKLVKPENKIINYLTEYSGVTAETLHKIDTRLCDVQEDIIRLLPADAILVGQSIENDLRALKMYHPFCVDTSDMFTKSGHRVKLADLAWFYLKREIQSGDNGHDPVEDAKAALDLFKLRLEKGDDLPGYKRRKGSQQPERIIAESSILAGCEDQRKTCAIVDIRRVIRQFGANAADLIECINDSESFKKAISAVKRRDFTWVQFHSLYNLLQGNFISEDNLQMTLQKLDHRLYQLYQSLPGKSLLITLMAPSDISSKQLGRCFVTLTENSL